VALRLGFENTSFFGKYFKKHFGCTPMEYRISHTQSSKHSRVGSCVPLVASGKAERPCALRKGTIP